MPSRHPPNDFDRVLVDTWNTTDDKAAVIAEKLGMKRNSLLARLHTLRVKFGVTIARRGNGARKTFNVDDQRAFGRGMTRGRVPLPINLSRSVEQLTPRQCRWPMGDTESNEFYFCPSKQCGNSPYCQHHHEVSREKRLA